MYIDMKLKTKLGDWGDWQSDKGRQEKEDGGIERGCTT